MANSVQTRLHHHPPKSTLHQHQHCHGSHLSESRIATEHNNIDHHLPHSPYHHNSYEHADIHLHHNPYRQHHRTKHEKDHRSSRKSHHRTSDISSNASMSSTGSSSCRCCSSSSASSSSSSSDSLSSSSASSETLSSNSSSSSSFSSSSSTSSWMSKSTLENAKFASKFKKGGRRPQHSQSCTDISKQRRALEKDEEDTVPLLNEDSPVKKSASIQKYLSIKEKCKDTTKDPKSSNMPSRKSTLNKKEGQTEIIRKAKSMEVLPVQNKQSGEKELNEKQIEKRKEEARKNIMREKMKFSAFLNEITRQVISPSRLQTLGVTAQGSISPSKSQDSAQAKGHKKTKHSPQQSESTNSVSSYVPSTHIRNHSSAIKKSSPPYHSNKTSNSIKHYPHHHQHKSSHKNHELLHHIVNKHTSNKTGSSKSHLTRSNHGYKAHKQQQAQSCNHLTNEIALNTKRNTQKINSVSTNPHHHYSHDHAHRGNHYSLSSQPCSPCSPPHNRKHHHRERKTHHHFPHSETCHLFHFHSDSHNHGDDGSPSLLKNSLCSENHYPPHSQSYYHVPSSPVYHHYHGDQRLSSPHNNFPHLESANSSSPIQHHHQNDSDNRSPSPLHFSLYSKNSDNSYSESLHHSPSPSCHCHYNDGHQRSSTFYASQHHHQGDHRSQSLQGHGHKDHDHVSYPDVHYHNSQPPSDDHHYHHHSYPNIHTHSEGGLKGSNDLEFGKQTHSHSYLDRPHQQPSHLNHLDHSGDTKTLMHSKYSHNTDSINHSHQDPKNSEFHDHPHLESSSHLLHTESQHHPEHSDQTPATDRHPHSKFQTSHPNCYKLTPCMESYHHYPHHKHPEFHHHFQHSQANSLRHSSYTDMHLQYVAPKTHHHHEYAESYSHSHFDGKSDDECSEFYHHHFHTKEHHHHGDGPSPLRSSPVGEKATSPCYSKSDDDQSVTSKETVLTIKGKSSEYERIMMLQDQNKDLRQTVVHMECSGSEFIPENNKLEAEVQRTQLDLSSTMEKFTRLQGNYSSIQQTDFQKDETHRMDELIDADCGKLNQQIAQLTKQLSDAKTTIQSLETISVTAMLQKALVEHFKSNDPIKPFKPAVAPPPFQFMDSDHNNKSPLAGDEQSLGTVEEEDEFNWIEMVEKAKHNGLSSLDKGQHGFTWHQNQGCWVNSDQYRREDGGTVSESDGNEMTCGHGLQIPGAHLQISIHPETLPIPLKSLKQNLDGPVGEECQIDTGLVN